MPTLVVLLCKRVWIGCLAAWSLVAATATLPAAEASPDDKAIWESTAGLFAAPPEFAGDLGSFRSPLVFYDGRPVASAADWPARRREILDCWHRLMGPWPPVFEKPEVDIVQTERREDFTQHKLRFRHLPGQMTDGYLLVPDGQGRRPAVLVVFYDPETSVGLGKPMRDFAYQLTRRGFVTLSMGNALGVTSKTYSFYYPSRDDAALQPLSACAYAAANAYHVLADRPEVDPARVGVMGHSFGGKWAMFAGCLYDKFACAAVSDPGIVFTNTRPSTNYWEPWYLGYQRGTWRTRGLITEANPATGLYPRLLAEGHDLHELHALMAPRPFFVSGGAEDQPQQWRALNHLVQVNRLLGHEHRVGMSNREKHEPTDESNEQLYRFFQHFLQGKRAP